MIEAVLEIDRNNIPGDIVECGVWKAGNIIAARKLSPKRVCWLYDTFTGMTKPGPDDVNRRGISALTLFAQATEAWECASLAEVQDILARHDVLDDNLTRFVVGDVCQTLIDKANLPDRIALLRLDTDWYASTLVELAVLYPRLEHGGILIVDDYGHWQGARKAVDEYFGADYPKTMIDYTACLIRK